VNNEIDAAKLNGEIILPCTVGWVDIGTTVAHECKSTENSKKKILVEWPSEERSFFAGSSTIYGSTNFFFITWGFWVSKDAEFNVDFKNINLP
jgi:hypothetical protein